MLNERIRQLRNKVGFSQSKLGDYMGVSQQAIGKWENGTAEPDIAALFKLSELFNCSISYLLGETNELIPKNGQKNKLSSNAKELIKAELIDRGIFKNDRDLTDEEYETFMELLHIHFKGRK